MRGWGAFSSGCSMDKLFFKPHELAARDRKERTGKHLEDINRLDSLS
jgi:hypothetical protein